MTAAAWLQIAALIGLLLLGTRLLGPYLAKVYGGGAAPGDRVFLPLERLIYRAGRIDPEREQPWTVYARSVIAFSLVSVLGLYALQRLQGWLPLNPSSVESVPPFLAFNTAVSFVTNTNWQNYGGESTMSDLIQMAGLTVQNFVSAAVGMAVAVALIRGFTRHRSETIGNFWVDLTRGVTRVLLPLALVLAVVLAGLGVVQTLQGPVDATTVEGATQTIYRGPDRQPGVDQGAGHERRRLRQRQLRASVREPDRPHQLPRDPRAAPASRSRSPTPSDASSATSARAGRSSPPCSRCGPGPRRRRRTSRCAATRASRSRRSTWRARRCASAPRRRRSSRPRRPARRPARSTPRTTASRPAAEPCRSSTCCSARSRRAASGPASTACSSSCCSPCSSPASWSGARPSTSARRSRRPR